MEILYNKKEGKLYSFSENQELGDQIWEADPTTQFNIKTENEFIREKLKRSHPMTGIFFDGNFYIGTNEGIIYDVENNKKMERVPALMFDEQVFIDSYPFKEGERELFEEYRKSGIVKSILKQSCSGEIKRSLGDIKESLGQVGLQKENVWRYIEGYLGIRGFVINDNILHDGTLLGINETLTGKRINDLDIHALYQLNEKSAGFVPQGYPFVPTTRKIIERGIEKRIKVHCIDYHSLWSLNGQKVFVRDICPRDGSGLAAAKFATDGETTAIAHGNYPYESIDIYRTEKGANKKMKSIELHEKPRKILIKDGEVFAYFGKSITKFLRSEQDTEDIKIGKISSVSDLGLCTIDIDEKTIIFDSFNDRRVGPALKGKYVFLPRTLQ